MTVDAARSRAVVIGGSMAGLLAARVLAESFAEVTVIDRDLLPACPEHRRGVPQARHAHALLAGGQRGAGTSGWSGCPTGWCRSGTASAVSIPFTGRG